MENTLLPKEYQDKFVASCKPRFVIYLVISNQMTKAVFLCRRENSRRTSMELTLLRSSPPYRPLSLAWTNEQARGESSSKHGEVK